MKKEPSLTGCRKGKTQEQLMTFEDAMKRLEEIVQSLEQGDTPLEESISIFEEGMGLSQFCSERLKVAEGKVQKLVELANGSTVLEDFSLHGKEN